MQSSQHIELHKKIDDTQSAVKDTNNALHAINNMLTKVLLKNEEIANHAREENQKQFDMQARVMMDMQKTQAKMQDKIDINTQDNIKLATLFSSRDRYFFAMGGFLTIFAAMCGYMFTSTINGFNAHFDKNDSAIITNDAKHNAIEDKLSDEISELQEFKRRQINVNLH